MPGDIVKLSAGDMISADLRLLESRDLFVTQSALRGVAMLGRLSPDGGRAEVFVDGRRQSRPPGLRA